MTVPPNIAFGGMPVCCRRSYSTIMSPSCSMAWRFGFQSTWLRKQDDQFYITSCLECSSVLLLIFFISGLACLFIGPLIDSINCLSFWLNNLSLSLSTSTLLLFLMLLLSFPPIFFFFPASVAYQNIAILRALLYITITQRLLIRV